MQFKKKRRFFFFMVHVTNQEHSQDWIYAILIGQILCSNVRFLPRKYYACQIISFIGMMIYWSHE